MDMLLGFLECFSLGDKKSPRILPTLPCSDMAEPSYSKRAKKILPLIQSSCDRFHCLGYFFELFSLF